MDWSSILPPIVGGVLIGLGAGALMLFSGRIAGVGGIFSGLLKVKAGDSGWRLAFALGVVAMGALLNVVAPQLFGFGVDRSLVAVAAGGLLIGFGACLGCGCTCGHSVCGLARLGPRSVVATLVFVVCGAATVFVVNHLMGGAI